ncbi:hypothetical protein HJC23_006841 [Cyclotella cryptica]|uniref:Uncharacterized protein n=1 Tax=Cyclotella cryptica TaxID=29204 RepID=A0ABD3PJT9_9STRA|eukprot:CCRYP_015099-RA/>CCRYP_015099-RA protein AED:0.03 eAED:0.03 QI:616/1/1/1/1/1/3/182/304
MSIYRQEAYMMSSTKMKTNRDVPKAFKERNITASSPSRIRHVPRFDPIKTSSSTTEMKSLEMTAKQSKFISDTMFEIRQKELEKRATKRIKVNHSVRIDNSKEMQDARTVTHVELIDEMELHPNIAQIVATSGGLITAWNDAFVDVVKPITSMHRIPLTIFDLVEPKSLHKLYGMLALALDEDSFFDEYSIDEEANDSLAGTSASTHLSIILPVKKFSQASTRYEVTIIFMDFAPTERSFLGWITPVTLSQVNVSVDSPYNCTVFSCGKEHNSESPPPMKQIERGTILCLKDTFLCQLLGRGTT